MDILQHHKCGLHRFAVPLREEDPPVARRQLVALPLLQVGVVLQPLVFLLGHVDFDLPPEPVVHWLRLVGLAGWHLGGRAGGSRRRCGVVSSSAMEGGLAGGWRGVRCGGQRGG